MKMARMLVIVVLLLGLVSGSYAAESIWTTKSDMPTARYLPSVGVVDGKIYAIGGTRGNPCLTFVEEYDPATDTWTRKANMPTPGGGDGCSIVNGRIYLIGGKLSLYGPNISPVREYDATTDTWSTRADMLTPRCWLSTSVIDGKIYAIGGALTYQGAPLSTVEEYDPATDTWTKKADMPTVRAGVRTSAVNGKIYAIGGSPGYGQWYQGLTIVEEYDPATDTWTRKADMPTGRMYFSTCVVNGKIYAIGGLESHNSDHVVQVEEYDPATDTWRTVANMPTARSGLATSAVDGKIYAMGGWIGRGTVLSTVEVYDPNPLVVDFNGDFKIDIEDLVILIESWGSDDSMCDIAPQPIGDGIVDALDLELLMSYWGQEILPPELIACWKLDEVEGDIAYNSVYDEHDGTLYGEPLWQPGGGMVDGAIELDGIDDYISTPFALNPADGAFSVFAWIKGGAPGQVIISQRDGVNWLMADPIDGALRTDIKSPERSNPRGATIPAGPPLISSAVITDSDWHRVGVVWDGSFRVLHVDDVEVARDATALSGLESADGGLYIGTGKSRASDSYWSGLIDDVKIYNRAITP